MFSFSSDNLNLNKHFTCVDYDKELQHEQENISKCSKFLSNLSKDLLDREPIIFSNPHRLKKADQILKWSINLITDHYNADKVKIYDNLSKNPSKCIDRLLVYMGKKSSYNETMLKRFNTLKIILAVESLDSSISDSLIKYTYKHSDTYVRKIIISFKEHFNNKPKEKKELLAFLLKIVCNNNLLYKAFEKELYSQLVFFRYPHILSKGVSKIGKRIMTNIKNIPNHVEKSISL